MDVNLDGNITLKTFNSAKDQPPFYNNIFETSVKFIQGACLDMFAVVM